jgi:putative intracellular protease/amidase
MITTLNPQHRSLRAVGAVLLLATLLTPSAVHADPLPVLMVLANSEVWYEEYARVRKELGARGLPVVVAAGRRADAIPQEPGLRRVVAPDVLVSEVSGADYSAVVFVGGWGASSYQYAFSGTYERLAHRPDPLVADAVNRLIGDFLAQDKPVAALSHGVTVLAWARVDGVSPLQGRTVAAWPGGSPAFKYEGQAFAPAAIPVSWHVVENGGTVRTAASAGDPLSSADDVVIDGRIITAEDYQSAALFARTLALAISGR